MIGELIRKGSGLSVPAIPFTDATGFTSGDFTVKPNFTVVCEQYSEDKTAQRFLVTIPRVVVQPITGFLDFDIVAQIEFGSDGTSDVIDVDAGQSVVVPGSFVKVKMGGRFFNLNLGGTPPDPFKGAAFITQLGSSVNGIQSPTRSIRYGVVGADPLTQLTLPVPNYADTYSVLASASSVGTTLGVQQFMSTIGVTLSNQRFAPLGTNTAGLQTRVAIIKSAQFINCILVSGAAFAPTLVYSLAL